MDFNNCTYNRNNDSTEHGLSFKELQKKFRLCLQTEALIRLKGQSNDIGRSIPFLHLGAGSYKQVSIKGKRYKLHRIIWALANGRWPNPEMQVDHINRDPRNNHPDNLREVTASQNQRNRAANRETGLYGVYRSAGGYRVGVRHKGKKFNTPVIRDKNIAAFVSDVLRVLVYGSDEIMVEQLNQKDRLALFFASAVSVDDLSDAVRTTMNAFI